MGDEADPLRRMELAIRASMQWWATHRDLYVLIEFARTVCGWEDAHSTEFVPDTPHPVIDLMAEQKEVTEKGGTMRLGHYDCHLAEGSRVRAIYGAEDVRERHRHRYEVNNHLRYKLKEHGMGFTGVNPERDLVEIVELEDHPWFVGVQFHPEYKTTVQNPHPLFVAFVGAAVAHAKAAGALETPRPPASTRKVRRASAKVLRSGDGEAGRPADVQSAE